MFTLCIRYRSTATLVSLILEVGYQSPHRTINSYVEKFSAFRPTDADEWTTQETEHPELPALSTLNLDRMSQLLSHVWNFSQISFLQQIICKPQLLLLLSLTKSSMAPIPYSRSLWRSEQLLLSMGLLGL